MANFFIIASIIVYAVLSLYVFPAVSDIDYYSVISEGSVTILVTLLLFKIQKARTVSRSSYNFMFIGVFFLLIASSTDLLDEVIEPSFIISTLFEDLGFLLGFLFVLLGSRDWIAEEEKIRQQLHELATTDYLTGLLNRRSFLQIASIELNQCLRHSRALSLLLIDIDHFKKINDTYGHAAGDEVLKKLALKLYELLRNTEAIARWGGEEFIVLIPESDQEASTLIANRLRTGIYATLFDFDGDSFQVSISLGGSTLVEQEDANEAAKDTQHIIDALISRADKALYQAKKQGRNCLCWV